MANMSYELDKIEARANAATVGPWVYHAATNGDPANGPMLHHVETEGLRYITHAQSVVAETDYSRDGESDAEFIAHAREDVPKLVAALRAVIDVANHGIENETYIGLGGATWPLVDARSVLDALDSALGGA